MTTTPTAPVGRELRRWRELRALSQLALATRAEVSTRHLSYVENGRSRPTPEMILRLAEALEVPRPEQNRLLLAAGFAPRHPRRGLEDADLAPVMAGLRSLLDAHAPCPALLLDDHWDIVDTNQAVHPLLVGCDPDVLEPPVNVLRLALHPGGLARRILNLPVWRAHLLHQLEQRIAHSGGDPRLVALREELGRYPGGHRDEPREGRRPVDPVVMLELATEDAPLRLFSVASRIEGPADLTLDALHLETFLPADESTRRRLSATGG